MHAHAHAVAKQREVLLHFFFFFSFVLVACVGDCLATSVKPKDCFFRASALVRMFPFAHKAGF